MVVLPVNRARKEHAERWERPAEGIVAGLLRLKGCANLARRLRRPVGEIDIVARRGHTIAVVEVKARSVPHAATNAVTPNQCRRIENAASWLIVNHHDSAACHLRFDLLLVQP